MDRRTVREERAPGGRALPKLVERK